MLTLHFIQDFKLHNIVLSFAKHKGGCTAEELQEQLFDSILSWQLCITKFVACVTDCAANMNKMGITSLSKMLPIITVQITLFS